jgi:DNA-damage-inducible protein J
VDTCAPYDPCWNVKAIDERIKEEASVVLAAMGLTVSDAFRIMLTRVAREKALPFEPLISNDVTIQAMKDARRGKGMEKITLDQLADEWRKA